MKLRLVSLLGLSIVIAGCVKLQPPPVELSYRDSLVGAGKIVQIENASNRALLGLEVILTAPSGESRTFTLDELAGYASVEIGWKKLGGWKIPDGADVSVSVDGYLFAFKGELASEGSE